MILFLIGIILVKTVDGNVYTHVPNNNCSQTFFDEATQNYMASFNFLSENINGLCPNAKAIALRKTDLLEVDMKIKVVENVWSILSKRDKFRLVYQLRNRLHWSCNSISLPKELCRTKYALEGGVFISTHDGSLSKYTFQKSCSICLLRTIIKEYVPLNVAFSSNVISRLNLSLINIVDWKELHPEDILSVKFIRSPDNHKISSNYTLETVLGLSSSYKSTLLSDTVSYNIQVKLRSSGRLSKKGQKPSDGCIFRCGWSSKCLSEEELICDNKKDCLNGDDENPLICQLYNRSYKTSNKNSPDGNFLNYNEVHNKTNQNEDYLRFIIPVIFSILILVIAGIGILIFYRHNKQKTLINKKLSKISNIGLSKIHNNSIYLRKSQFDEFVAQTSIHGRPIESQRDVNEYSGLCEAKFHQNSKNNDKQFIHPKYFRKPEKQDKFCNEQYSDLCEQINYPDLRTRSNWLRAYFQLSRSNNVRHNKPPVLNVCHLPPVSFSCKQ